MPQPVKKLLSPEEYLAIDREAEVRSEYFDGEMFLMTGASPAHNLIAVNTATALNNALRDRPCRVFVADMRVRIANTPRYLYPDVSVVCGDLQLEGDREDILVNPGLVVEVLSPSTENYDRVRKFDAYRQAPTLQEYLLIAQDQPRVQLYRRQDNGTWLFIEMRDFESHLDLASVDCQLPLSEIYRKVEFPKPPESENPV